MDPVENQARAEGLAAVFRTLEFGVFAAWLTSVILSATLVSYGIAAPERCALFVAFLSVCALLHVLLARRYKKSRSAVSAWRRWGLGLAAVAFLEGLAWGWAPVGLPSATRLDAQLLCLIATLGVVAGAIPALSPYLPSFAALFVPATVPYGIFLSMSPQPLHQGMAVLMMVYVIAIGSFAVVFNRSYRRLVDLRLHAETLAQDLRRQKDIAETANRAKSSFLAAASHDLRQPVHALGLFVGALRAMPMSPAAMSIIEQIEASSQAMDGLFAALLDISRLDAGLFEANREVFAIGPMIQRIGREHAGEASEKRIKVKVHSCGAFLDSDPILVERVLRNLVTNAVRYTRHGRVVVGCRRKGPLLSVEVHDTGPGIPPEQRDLIFEEFYQIGNVERDRSKGLGLGLAIVRRLTTLLGCPMTLRSEIGRGSCFAVAIPRAEGAAIHEAREADWEARLTSGRTIVVVDDEADIRAAMSTVLGQWGHRVIAASDGAEAIGRLADCPVRPDLIISDFRLRGRASGIDVIAMLRTEYDAEIPAILVTGDTAPERLIEAKESGLLLLHKPVSNGRLRAAITNVMSADVS